MGVMAGIKAVFEVEGIIHGTTRKPFTNMTVVLY